MNTTYFLAVNLQSEYVHMSRRSRTPISEDCNLAISVAGTFSFSDIKRRCIKDPQPIIDRKPVFIVPDEKTYNPDEPLPQRKHLEFVKHKECCHLSGIVTSVGRANGGVSSGVGGPIQIGSAAIFSPPLRAARQTQCRRDCHLIHTQTQKQGQSRTPRTAGRL